MNAIVLDRMELKVAFHRHRGSDATNIACSLMEHGVISGEESI